MALRPGKYTIVLLLMFASVLSHEAWAQGWVLSIEVDIGHGLCAIEKMTSASVTFAGQTKSGSPSSGSRISFTFEGTGKPSSGAVSVSASGSCTQSYYPDTNPAPSSFSDSYSFNIDASTSNRTNCGGTSFDSYVTGDGEHVFGTYSFYAQIVVTKPASGCMPLTISANNCASATKSWYVSDSPTGTYHLISGKTGHSINVTADDLHNTAFGTDKYGARYVKAKYLDNTLSGYAYVYVYPDKPVISGVATTLTTCPGDPGGTATVSHTVIGGGESYVYTVRQWVKKGTDGCSTYGQSGAEQLFDDNSDGTPETPYCKGYIANFGNTSGTSSFQLTDNNKLAAGDAQFAFRSGWYDVYAESQLAIDSPSVACPSDTYSFKVSDPPPISIDESSVATSKPTCLNGNDGYITFKVNAGKPNFKWWVTTSNSNGTATALNTEIKADTLTAGTYTLTVTDGCNDTDTYSSVQVQAGSPIFVTNVIDKQPNCYTDNTNTNAGSEWDGKFTATATNITGKTYTFTLYSSGGDAVSLAAYQKSQSGRVMTYQYLPGGSYYVTVSTSNGCSATSSLYTVLTTPGALTFDSRSVDIRCSNGTDGHVRLHTFSKPNTTSISYNYTINKVGDPTVLAQGGPVTGTLTIPDNLAIGKYTGVVTDNCAQSSGTHTIPEVEITRPLPIAVVEKADEFIKCYDGTTETAIQINHTDGTTPFDIEVTRSNNSSVFGFPSLNQTPRSFTLNSLTRDTYIVKVTDDCGLSDTMKFEIKSKATTAITAQVSKHVYSNTYNLTCPEDNNGKLVVDISGGIMPIGSKYQVEILNGSSQPYNSGVVSAGTSNSDNSLINYEITSLAESIPYIIRVRDVNTTPGACERTFSSDANDANFSLTTPAALNITTPNINTDFSGVQIYGGALYVQCKGDNTASYTAKVTGGNPSYTINLFKKQPSETSWSAIPYRTATNVSTGNATFANLGAGDYKVEVTDQQSCDFTPRTFTINEAQQDIEVSSITPLVYSHGAHTQCFGDNTGQITVNALGGVGLYSYLLTSDFGHNIPFNNTNDASYDFTSLIALNPSGDTIQYHVALRDEIGCYWDESNGVSPTIKLSPPDTVEFSWEVISRTVPGYEIPCYGNSATVRITSEGGKYPHTVVINGKVKTLSGPGSYADFKLVAGTYTASFSDDLSCSAPDQTIVLIQPGTSHVEIYPGTIYHPVCIGGTDGEINLSASGGMQNAAAGQEYSFVVKEMSAAVYDTDTLRGTAVMFLRPANGYFEREYNVKVIDRYECISIDTITMPANPSPLKLTVDTLVSPSCYGGSDGFITITASNYDLIGGTSLIFKLGGGDLNEIEQDTVTSATHTFSGLHATDLNSATFFNAWVQDANACIDSADQYLDTLALPSYDQITNSLIEMIRPSCFNGDDGSIYMQVAGGVEPYVYSVNNIDYQPVDANKRIFLDGLTARVDTVYIRDANYKSSQPVCLLISQFTIDSGRVIRLEGNVSAIACKGGGDGAIDLSTYIDNRPAGEPVSSADLSFSWTHDNISSLPFNNSEDVNSLTKGTYTVHAIYDVDSLQCHNEKTFIVPEPDLAFRISELKIYDATCGNHSDGRALITVSGGWPDSLMYYRLDAGAWTLFNGSTFVLSNLSQGTHNIEVSQSGFLCTDDADFQITAATLELTATSHSPSCPMGTNGAVVLEIDNAGVEFAQVSGPFQQLPSFTGLSADTLQFIARLISDPTCISNIVEAIIVDPADCGDGPLAIELLGKTSATCEAVSDGQAQVRALGGTPPYHFFWDGSSIEESDARGNLSPTTHTVTVHDALDSVQTITFSIAALPPLTVSPVSTLTPCAGSCEGTLSILAAGGSNSFNIQWSDTTLTDFSRVELCTGAYDFVVSDVLNSGCNKSGTETIDHYPSITISQGATRAPTCPGGLDGYLTAEVAGGSGSYDILWSNGLTEKRIEGYAPAMYSITVADRVLGCISETLTYALPDADSIKVVSEIVSAPLCHGGATGTAELVLTNVSSPLVRWENGQLGLKAVALSTGAYQYSIVGSNGCSIEGAVEIPDQPQLIVNASIIDGTCFGQCNGTVQLSIEGGASPYFISWNHGPKLSTIRNLCSGAYSYTVTDNNKCKVSSSATVSTPEKLLLSYSKENVKCAGSFDGSATFNATGGVAPYHFVWSNGAEGPALTAANAGTYSVNVTDSKECFVSGTITISEPDAIFTTNILAINPSCPSSSDGQISLTSGGGTAPHSFHWADNNSTTRDRTNLPAGTYELTITDANGCTGGKTITLYSPSSLSISNIKKLDPHCFGEANGSLSADVSGGAPPYGYQWSTGSTSESGINMLKAGDYSLTATDSKGCTASMAFTLLNPEQPFIVGVPEQIVICTGSYAVAEPDGDWLRYQWTGPSGFSATSKRLDTNIEGTYKLTAWDARECPAGFTLIVDESPNALVADFLRLSEAIAYDPIVFVDISQPVPQRIEWVLPDDPNVVTNSTTNSVLEILFTATGEFEIGMKAYLDNCMSELYKKVLIEEPAGGRGTVTDGDPAEETDKEDVAVNAYPNPAADGHVQIIVHAQSVEPISVKLISNIDSRVIKGEKLEGYHDYLIRWDDLNGAAGVYFLIYEQQGKVKSKRVVIIR